MSRDPTAGIRLITPKSPIEVDDARHLVRAYAKANLHGHAMEDVGEEIARLDSWYATPLAGLIVAYVGDHAAGCCAFRPLPEADHVNACEMKRLFVSPLFRGMGLGRLLVDSVLEDARTSGYSCVLLDTLDEMETARALYQETGFVEIPPYTRSPVPGAHHLKVVL